MTSCDTSSLKVFENPFQQKSSSESIQQWNLHAEEYAMAGGFPQLWENARGPQNELRLSITTLLSVTLEDLRLVKEIRRPEIFHQFLRYAFARTGQETQS